MPGNQVLKDFIADPGKGGRGDKALSSGMLSESKGAAGVDQGCAASECPFSQRIKRIRAPRTLNGIADVNGWDAPRVFSGQDRKGLRVIILAVANEQEGEARVKLKDPAKGVDLIDPRAAQPARPRQAREQHGTVGHAL